MKILIIILSILTFSCTQNTQEPCEEMVFEVVASRIEKPKGEVIDVTFTSYKVNEKRFNPGRKLINNIEVKDAFSVPAVIALPAKYEKLLNVVPYDTIVCEIDGKKHLLVFLDRMSNKEKYAGRADILINRDQPHFKKVGKIYKKV